MPESNALSFFVCFGFIFFLIPTIICIVLAVRLSDLRQRVEKMELHIKELSRELFTRARAPSHMPAAPAAAPQPATPVAGQPAAPASHPAPRGPAPQTPTPHATPTAAPHAAGQPAITPPHPQPPAPAPVAPAPHPPALPTRPPVAAHAPADDLVSKMQQFRKEEPRAAAPATPVAPSAPVTPPTTPPAITPVAAPITPPAVPHAPPQPAPISQPVTDSTPVAPLPTPPVSPSAAPAAAPSTPAPTAHPTGPAMPVPSTPHAPAPPIAGPAPAHPPAMPHSPPSLPQIPHTAPVAAQSPAHPVAPHPAAPHPVAPRPSAPVPAVPPIAKPARKPRSLEFYFVAAGIVIGAICLALAAIFGVKVGIENGLFGPLQRDCATALCALALIGVGQWRRRYEGFWSQGLTAAGIVAAFAAAFAATGVHHILTPIEGFVCLAIATAGAVAMSLQDWSGGSGESGGRARGGMLIAILGLIGGFVTPILVNSGRDDVPGLFGYLILLHVGLVFATRIRGWTLLAAASVVLSSLWLIFWTLFKWTPAPHSSDGAILGMFMLATIVTLVISTLMQPEKWRGGKAGMAASVLTWLGVGLGLLASCLLLGKSQYDDLQWMFFAMLVLGAFVLARLRPVYEAMAWLCSFTVLAMLVAWGFSLGAAPQGVEAAHAALDYAAEHLRFQTWLMGFGGASVVAAFACQWKSAAPLRWAVLANVLALAYVAAGYWLVPALPRADAWGWLPVIAAGGLAVLMVPCIVRRERIVNGEGCLTVYAHAILALLLAAAPMGLSGSHITAAWAALLPVAALALWRLRLPGLSVGLLGTAFLVALRGLMIGSVFDAAGAGRTLWWNPVVWSYGSILLSMAAAAFFLDRAPALPERWRTRVPGPKTLAALMQAGAAVAAFLLFTLEVRWGFHAGKLDANSALLSERGTFALGWLLLGAALTWMGKQIQQKILLHAGEVVAILGIVYAVVGLVIVTNPLWWQWQGAVDEVGGIRAFNLLVFAYGMPAAACALVAWVIGQSDPQRRILSTVSAAAGIILLLTMVSLQVRQGFVGSDLTLEHAAVSFREFATYSVAWLGLGALCLAIGRRFRREVLWRAGIWMCTGGVVYAIAIVGLAMSPLIHHQWIGDYKICNDLLYAYGAPILLAALAAAITDPRMTRLLGPMPAIGDKAFLGSWSLGGLLRVGILMLLFILVTTEVRQWFQGAYLDVTQITFLERSLYPVAWLVLAAALLGAGAVGQARWTRNGGMTIAAIGLGFALLINTLLLNPLWTGENVGQRLIVNDLLVTYGIPVLLCGLIAWLIQRQDARDSASFWCVITAGLALLFTLITTEVRQGFHPAQLNAAHLSFLERSTYPVAWLVLAGLLLAAGYFLRSDAARRGGLVFASIGLGFAFLINTLLLNPLWTGEDVGTGIVWNHLLYGFGAPAVFCGVLAWLIHRRDAAQWALARTLATGAIVLLFALTTLELRQGFQGPILNALQWTFLEHSSYPVAWLALGAALLAAGVRLKSDVVRQGGLVIAALGLTFALLVNTLVLNPLWTGEGVGRGVVFNHLLLTYAVPALLCGLVAWLVQHYLPGLRAFAQTMMGGLLGLVFVLISLEIRQGFAGATLGIVRHPIVFLEYATYGVAWMALAAVWLATGLRWQMRLVRHAGAGLAIAGLGFTLAVVALAANPILQGGSVGEWKIFNQLLYAYGVPALLAALTAWIVHPDAARWLGDSPDDSHSALPSHTLGRLMRAGVVALLFVLVGMETRQWFQGAELHRFQMAFWERGTYGIAWLALAGALLAAGYAFQSQAGRRGGLLIAGVGLGWSLFICALLMNPLWIHESVGSIPIVNGILYAYGIPAAAAGVLAGALWARKPWEGSSLTEHVAAWIAAIAALLLVFVVVTLEVQHAFRGDHLSLAASQQSEFVAYSLAWGILGVIYVVAGIWRKSVLLRGASLVMMLITIPKVFLADMPALHDLQRVLSFAGLGVSLMLLGFFYIRFVFPRPARAPEPPAPLPPVA